MPGHEPAGPWRRASVQAERRTPVPVATVCRVELCVFVEPQQGATYEQQLAVARAAEDLGFDGFFRSDHYLGMNGSDGLPGPTDAWITLAGLARETSRVRLGTLVSPVTFRLPGVLAVTVAQVDRMSGGRVELGLGAGWYAAEHRALGIPFPEVGERYDSFEEQLAIVSGLLSTPAGETYSFAGAHYRIEDSPALPKPVQDPVPLILGGSGRRRLPPLVARHATEYNAGFTSVQEQRAAYERVRQACRDIGRDPASLRWSTALTTVVGRDRAQVARRASVAGADVEKLAVNGLVGTPDQVAERIRAYADAGSQRIYLQLWDLTDLDQLELLATSMMPQVR